MNVEFKREALFREVWEVPISTLAKKYGLSDVGLRKVCIALAIPLPGRGHWAKVAAGHKIAAPLLPSTAGVTQFVCRLPDEKDMGILRPRDDPWLRDRLAFEADPANAVVVPTQLSRPHRLVSVTARVVRAEVKELERSRKARERPRRPEERFELNWSALMHPNWDDYERRGHLMEPIERAVPMRIAIESVERALRIWDALLKACDVRGMRVSIEPRQVKVQSGDECVGLRMSEKVDWASRSTPARAGETLTPRPTGRLRIFVVDRGETKFEDIADRPLESQVNDILRWIYRCMASLRHQRQVWAEDRRRAEIEAEAREVDRIAAVNARRLRDEEARHQQAEIEAENERARLLVAEANAWRQAETIRAYVAHLTSTITASGTPVGPELSAWLTWAAEVAERLDPSSKRLT